MGDRPYHDDETLRRLYHDKELSQSEIADRFDVKPNTISEWMSRHDITTRPHQDAPHKSADVLRYLHHEEKLSLKEMGERLDRSHSTILHWMKKHDIPRRSANRKRYTIPEDELRRLYVDERKSAYECAEEFGCTPPIIRARLQENDIPIRRGNDARRATYGRSVPLRIDKGYYRWSDGYSGEEVAVHQLAAIANGADPYDIFANSRKNVHHKNTYRLDNRPANLEVIDNDDHAATHRKDEWVVRGGWPELKTIKS